MYPSPLLLDRYVVTEFSFKAHADYNYPAENEHDGKVELADLKAEVVPHQHKDDPSRWIFGLNIELPESSERRYPYSFKIELVGFFEIDAKYPSDKARLLANANAPALLYSSAREFLASVTGRGPYMALWLPSAMFIKQVGSVQTSRSETASAKPVRKAVKKKKKSDPK